MNKTLSCEEYYALKYILLTNPIYRMNMCLALAEDSICNFSVCMNSEGTNWQDAWQHIRKYLQLSLVSAPFRFKSEVVWHEQFTYKLVNRSEREERNENGEISLRCISKCNRYVNTLCIAIRYCKQNTYRIFYLPVLAKGCVTNTIKIYKS